MIDNFKENLPFVFSQCLPAMKRAQIALLALIYSYDLTVCSPSSSATRERQNRRPGSYKTH